MVNIKAGLKTKKPKYQDSDLLLAIDPASHSAGAALFYINSAEHFRSVTLTSEEKYWPQRMHAMQNQMIDFMADDWQEVKIIVSELIPKLTDPTVQVSAGPLVACLPFPAVFYRSTFVSPTSWKAWARSHGAKSNTEREKGDVKGMKALSDIMGEDYVNFLIKSDDQADAVLIGLCWLNTKLK